VGAGSSENKAELSQPAKLELVGAAATYLEVQQPHIWFTVKIRLTQPQVELELGLSLVKIYKGI
jgi:hypothetical protein